MLIFLFCGTVYKSRPDLAENPLNIHILTRAPVCLFQHGASILYHCVRANVLQTCLFNLLNKTCCLV